MPVSMTRGKHQILFNYLPERTVEFPRGAAIAKISQIVGTVPQDLNHEAVVRRVAAEVRAWREEWRPGLRDQVLRDPTRFELIDPEVARSELFPRVFWCQNRSCGRVFDYTNSDSPPGRTCSRCRSGQLVQIRFVKVHHCGQLEPLTAPPCNRCDAGAREMALHTRGSERMANFRWVCLSCGNQMSLFAGYCPACPPTGRREDRLMNIQLHRAGKAYCPHTTILLNIPHGQIQGLFARTEEDWATLVAAKCLQLPELASRSLADLAGRLGASGQTQTATVSADALADLSARVQRGEITPEEMAAEIQNLTRQAQASSTATDPRQLCSQIVERTGVPAQIWHGAGYDLLESVLATEGPMGSPPSSSTSTTSRTAAQLGGAQVQLLSDFPIVTATYGYTRLEYDPNRARLNPFPPDPRRSGRFPIFVDRVQADAIRVCLNNECLIGWLRANGLDPAIPSGSDPHVSSVAYFIRLFHDTDLRATIGSDHRELRMVFGVLHTLSHLCVRQAALLCGLERTSLSEYILPRTLEFILYCNHREGATIGALTAMFEQTLPEWLEAVSEARTCVYDPVCADSRSDCHACTHLAETSCRFFNLNLSRALLFGGRDRVLGVIGHGFIDFARTFN